MDFYPEFTKELELGFRPFVNSGKETLHGYFYL